MVAPTGRRGLTQRGGGGGGGALFCYNKGSVPVHAEQAGVWRGDHMPALEWQHTGRTCMAWDMYTVQTGMTKCPHLTTRALRESAKIWPRPLREPCRG